MTHYEKAVALDGAMLEAKSNLAALYIRAGNPGRAAELCEAVLVSWVTSSRNCRKSHVYSWESNHTSFLSGSGCR